MHAFSERVKSVIFAVKEGTIANKEVTIAVKGVTGKIDRLVAKGYFSTSIFPESSFITPDPSEVLVIRASLELSPVTEVLSTVIEPSSLFCSKDARLGALAHEHSRKQQSRARILNITVVLLEKYYWGLLVSGFLWSQSLTQLLI